MNNSKIEWTDKTWNPVTGCTKVSQGCKNCYAERMYERFHGYGSFKNIICHEDRLAIPMRWKKPSMIFVNSMSDLFHKSVPFEFIKQVYDVMAKCKMHTFQILTKRPARMVEYHKWLFENVFPKEMDYLPVLSNVWLGVSCEDQKTANERIPYLLQTPAVVRFLSCEPLLSSVDLTRVMEYSCGLSWRTNSLTGKVYEWESQSKNGNYDHGHDQGNKIDWVIVGGESGPGARPMHPEWPGSIRDQCKAAGVSFFFKQWGEFMYQPELSAALPVYIGPCGKISPWRNDEYARMIRVGKKRAGRMLDGIEHNEMPPVNHHLEFSN